MNKSIYPKRSAAGLGRNSSRWQSTSKRSRKQKSQAESSGGRMLAVLGLFTIESPEWTVEEAAESLGASVSTTYRYFRALTKVGLLSPVSRAGYMLGPAIIELDRQIQMCDPMLRAARGVMSDLIGYAPEGTLMLLCRRFQDRVICVHQVFGRGPHEPVSYERGRPMPLFRGATSKVILAHLPPHTLKALFARRAHEIAAAGLGDNWDAFKRALAALRRDDVCITKGEVDPGRVGIAAPIFDPEQAILGSLTFVLPVAQADEARMARLVPLTVAGAREVEQAMIAGGTRQKLDSLMPAGH
jgi:DNA-binding IclR family transcriptional regulator